MKRVLILTCVVFLAGCGTLEQSRSELISQTGKKIEFQADKNYQEVYRIIKNRLQDNNYVWLMNDGRTDGDLYADKQTAFVSYIMNDAFFGADTKFYADIKAINEQKTNIAIYHCKGGLIADGWGDVSRDVMELVKK